MDIAFILDILVPGAEYFGSLTENTQEAFDAITWVDVRAKPAWQDILAQETVPGSTSPVKIYSLTRADAEFKHFHLIDYTIEVTPALIPKRTFLFGALTNVKWYADAELTNLILEVDVSYNYNALGFATDRAVTRTWYREDGSADADTKITEKYYTINPQDQLDEIIVRRTNIVRQTNVYLIGIIPGLTAIDPNAADMTAQDIIFAGQTFFGAHDTEENVFIKTGSTVLEDAVRNETDSSCDWFNTDATPLGIPGVSDIRGFIIYQLSSGQRTS